MQTKKGPYEILKEEALDALLSFSKTGIMLIDKNCSIVYINDWACHFLGLNQQETLHRNIVELFPKSELAEVKNTGDTHKNRITIRNNKKIVVNRIPLKKDGSIIGAVSLFQDFAEVSENEADIRTRLWESGLAAKYTFADISHASQIMDDAITLAKAFAKTNSPVLIFGESGTGKELFAQSMHNESGRKAFPFVALNCATLTENILEAELFGYEDGAFTGAKKGGKAGLFQIAHKGTLFLDEIGDIPLSFQAKFLRALQEQQIRPVGGGRMIPIDVRIIAATNKDLQAEVENGAFRLDLLYRLNVLNLSIKPLKERPEDIIPIALSYLNKKQPEMYQNHKQVIDSTLSLLQSYCFPGNIRELENILDRMCLLLHENLLKQDTDILLSQLLLTAPPVKTDTKNTLAEAEKEQIIQLLLACRGSRKEVAQKLQISTSTLWRKMKRYNIT